MERKLRWQQAQDIRTRYAAGGVSSYTLADEYDLSPTRVQAIIRGKSYRFEVPRVDIVREMPCPVTSGDLSVMSMLPAATLATAERREAITARERAAWRPDDEYRAAVARWLTDDAGLLEAAG